MADVRSQAAGDTGTVALAVVCAVDGIFSLFLFNNLPRFPVTGELQQVLVVFRLDKHTVLVIRVEGYLAVVLFFLQDVVQPVIQVFRPFVPGAVYPCDTSGTVALILAAQPVETDFRNYLSQPVQLEEIVVARLVSDAPELQLAVVAECDPVAFLLTAFQYSQRPIGELHFTDVVRSMYHVPHGVVLEPVHVTVRFFQPYQVVRPVIGVPGGIAFDIHRLYKPAPAVVFPPAEQAVGEPQQFEVVAVVEGEGIDASLPVGNGMQYASLVSVFHGFPAEGGAADDTVHPVVIPRKLFPSRRAEQDQVAVSIVAQERILAVLVRYPDRLTGLVVGSLAGIAFGVDRDLQFLISVVLLARDSPIGIHYLVDELVLPVMVFGFGTFPVTDMGVAFAVADEVLHDAAVPPCMHTTGVLTFALVFPMEGHASLVGQLYQQMPVGIDKMLADIQRIDGLHHVAPVVITIADKPGFLTVLSHGHTAYPSQSVGFHLQAFPPRRYDSRQFSSRSVFETDAEPVFGGYVRHHAVAEAVLRSVEPVLQSPDIGQQITLPVKRPEQLFLAVKIGVSRFQHGQERLPSVGMAEEESPFFQPPDTQVVTVVPVVTQRAIHGGIAVISAFPNDGDGAGQFEIHVGVVHPACCRIDRLAECLAFDGLKNVRQPVLSFLSQSVNQVLELVAQFLPHFSQPLEPELHCQREHVDGGRSAHEHRLAYGSDGGEHGCGCQQRLAHLLGLSLAGNGRDADQVAGERRMCQRGAGGTVRQHGRAAHPHFRLGHAADQRCRVQDECRQVHDAYARLRNPLVMHLHRGRHPLENAARHSRHPFGNGWHGGGDACHDVRHEVIYFPHMRHGHDG